MGAALQVWRGGGHEVPVGLPPPGTQQPPGPPPLGWVGPYWPGMTAPLPGEAPAPPPPPYPPPPPPPPREHHHWVSIDEAAEEVMIRRGELESV